MWRAYKITIDKITLTNKFQSDTETDTHTQTQADREILMKNFIKITEFWVFNYKLKFFFQRLFSKYLPSIWQFVGLLIEFFLLFFDIPQIPEFLFSPQKKIMSLV